MFKRRETKEEERRETLMDLKYETQSMPVTRDTVVEKAIDEEKEVKTKNGLTFKKFLRALKRNRRLQIFVAVLLVAIVLLAFLIAKGIGVLIYHSTDEYKLIKLGYEQEEAQTILANCSEEELKIIFKHEYNGTIDNFLGEKYCLFNNLERYLEYQKAYPTEAYSDIVTKVNVNRDRDYYSDIKQTDTTLNERMLVNKYYCLSSSYAPAILETIPLSYCYGELKLDAAALDALEAMCDAARKEGHTIVADAAFRTYEWQSDIWVEYKDAYGIEYADEVAARAGSSDHQTGLAVNLLEFENSSRFDQTASYQWMMDHAYEYGFIQRYPEGKEDITGFTYEPGHFRFVGLQAAKEIHDLGITFDEYYALYLESPIN